MWRRRKWPDRFTGYFTSFSVVETPRWGVSPRWGLIRIWWPPFTPALKPLALVLKPLARAGLRRVLRAVWRRRRTWESGIRRRCERQVAAGLFAFGGHLSPRPSRPSPD